MTTNIPNKIYELISTGETVTSEFKSDVKGLSDRDLIAAVVALANTEGGNVLLGVEDNGKITGLNQKHQQTSGIPPLIANKTNPSLKVEVDKYEQDGKFIAHIQVPKSHSITATTDGLILRRKLKHDGTPESVPFYPHEFTQRQSSLGLIDPSAAPILSLTVEALNALERQRIREAIRRYGGDSSLLDLNDSEFDGALGFVITHEGVKRPTLAGLLFLGTEELMSVHVPAHEVAFQVLEDTDVRVNEFFRKPLLRTFEEVERLFAARVTERELQVGLFRVPVPNFDKRAFREAFVNALVHRDYSRLAAVHVRIDDSGLTISNPGGFIEGVNLNNLLVTEPRSRNPRLADITKRIGLCERTGRGIDRIYQGVLRYGRPAPDYARSTSNSVILRMLDGEGDLDFLELVLKEEERTGRAMPLDSLIILSRLKQERRLKTVDLARSTQKSEHETRVSLEKLVEAGLIEAHGDGRGRSYTLSARLYSKTGEKTGYIRQAGFDLLQQEQMVINYIKQNNSIKRGEAAELCRISPDQAKRLLKKLLDEGRIIVKGKKKGTYYILIA